jgi:hypothetical protein
MLRRPDRGVAWLAATVLTVLSLPGARCGVSEPSSNHAQAHENGRGERVNYVVVSTMHHACNLGHAHCGYHCDDTTGRVQWGMLR